MNKDDMTHILGPEDVLEMRRSVAGEGIQGLKPAFTMVDETKGVVQEKNDLKDYASQAELYLKTPSFDEFEDVTKGYTPTQIEQMAEAFSKSGLQPRDFVKQWKELENAYSGFFEQLNSFSDAMNGFRNTYSGASNDADYERLRARSVNRHLKAVEKRKKRKRGGHK